MLLVLLTLVLVLLAVIVFKQYYIFINHTYCKVMKLKNKEKQRLKKIPYIVVWELPLRIEEISYRRNEQWVYVIVSLLLKKQKKKSDQMSILSMPLCI